MLFILEMANNHGGSLERGKEIIRQFYEVTKNFPQFKFAFKFQRREWHKFIHKDYKNRIDITYIKRFQETQLTFDELVELKDYAKSLGFLTICTPFDEDAVDTVKNIGFDYLKIGSCSITDWSLLNKIASVNMPVIGSIGGIDNNDVNKVITFFQHRQIPLILMYCVGLYPSMDNQLSLNKIDDLHKNFPHIEFGFSSHEAPDNIDAIKIAIAKGITIFEKHVDIEHVNNYSITPLEYNQYLLAANKAIEICTINNNTTILEQKKLNALKRGAFLSRHIKTGETFTINYVYFAFPCVDNNTITANECSKYFSFVAKENLKPDEPLNRTKIDIYDNTALLYDVYQNVKNMLDKHRVVYPSPTTMDISHHYGLNKFPEYGMCLITLINDIYCKKLLILLPGQTNPEHYHKLKKETFFILAGNAEIIVDGIMHKLSQGSILTIEQNQLHEIKSTTGVIIEDLSSTAHNNDSYYTDINIMYNTNRKTQIYV